MLSVACGLADSAIDPDTFDLWSARLPYRLPPSHPMLSRCLRHLNRGLRPVAPAAPVGYYKPLLPNFCRCGPPAGDVLRKSKNEERRKGCTSCKNIARARRLGLIEGCEG